MGCGNFAPSHSRPLGAPAGPAVSLANESSDHAGGVRQAGGLEVYDELHAVAFAETVHAQPPGEPPRRRNGVGVGKRMAHRRSREHGASREGQKREGRRGGAWPRAWKAESERRDTRDRRQKEGIEERGRNLGKSKTPGEREGEKQQEDINN